MHFMSVRPAFFEYDNYFYSNGGAIFLISYNGLVLAISCKHVLDPSLSRVDEDWRKLRIQTNVENEFLKPESCFFFISPSFQGKSELDDLFLWDFGRVKSDHINLNDTIDMKQVACNRAKVGDDLRVKWFPKDQLNFDTTRARIRACGEEDLLNVTGMSGSLVWNLSRNCPAGMILRGGNNNYYYATFEWLRKLILSYFAACDQH